MSAGHRFHLVTPASVPSETDVVLAQIRAEIRPRVAAFFEAKRRRRRRELLSKVLHRTAAVLLLFTWSFSWYFTHGISLLASLGLGTALTLLFVAVLVLIEIAGPEDLGRVVAPRRGEDSR